MKLKWHGTASLEITSSKGKLLFDPYIPLKGAQFVKNISDYDGFSDIFVTHGHFDHIANIPSIIKRNPETIVHCTKVPFQTLLKKGVPERNLHLIEHGKTYELNGFTINTYHGKHAILPKAGRARIRYALASKYRFNLFSIAKEAKTSPEGDEIVFYEIKADNKVISLMGSMNLRDEISYPTGSDYLILPYNGWEDNLPPAKLFIEQLKPERVLLDHYDDAFPPLTMPLNLDPIINAYHGKVSPLQFNREIEL